MLQPEFCGEVASVEFQAGSNYTFHTTQNFHQLTFLPRSRKQGAFDSYRKRRSQSALIIQSDRELVDQLALSALAIFQLRSVKGMDLAEH